MKTRYRTRVVVDFVVVTDKPLPLNATNTNDFLEAGLKAIAAVDTSGEIMPGTVVRLTPIRRKKVGGK